MNFIDLFFILMVFFVIFSGYTRGFMISLISFVRFLIGVPLSFAVSNNYASVIYNDYIKTTAIEKITSQIEKTADIDTFVGAFKDAVNEIPFGLADSTDFSFLENATSTSLANGIVNNILEPLAIATIKIVLFALTLWAFYVITWIIIKIFRLIFSGRNVPFRRTNKFLGAVFGVLKSVVAVFALAAILDFVRDICLGAEGEHIVKLISQLNSSVILEFVNKFNPILTM